MELSFEQLTEDLLRREYLIWMKNYSPSMTKTRLRNTYDHNLSVAKKAYRLARIFRANIVISTRAGLLHDCWLEKFREYSWLDRLIHNHYQDSVLIAQEFGENKEVLKVIRSHMFPIGPIPINKESWIVWLADKIVATEEIFNIS
ncbi:MAG: HDIG domain-containing protein [Candidatus Pacebacteria bacterium]|nr:HDIG domain-containing protein [Candidatus Paceibacterota bacterium]